MVPFLVIFMFIVAGIWGLLVLVVSNDRYNLTVYIIIVTIFAFISAAIVFLFELYYFDTIKGIQYYMFPFVVIFMFLFAGVYGLLVLFLASDRENLVVFTIIVTVFSFINAAIVFLFELYYFCNP